MADAEGGFDGETDDNLDGGDVGYEDYGDDVKSDNSAQDGSRSGDSDSEKIEDSGEYTSDSDDSGLTDKS